MKTFISRSLNRTYPACFRNSLSLMIVVLAFNASAQSVNFKIKWDQPPDLLTPTNIFYGWNDESVCEWVVVADDWACTNADPVTKIRWWGSFIGWKQQQSPILPLEWKVQIWTDVPAGVDERFSHPGKAIWEVRRPGTALIPECVGQDYDPRDPPQPGDPNIANPWETCYRWELPLGPSEFFFQNPLIGTNIYWISISARYDTNVQGPIDFPFGLKTLPRDTNSLAPDDAVRMFGPSLSNPTNGTTWVVGEGEPIYYPTTNDSWDIAFELCTSNTVTTVNSKWEQRPDLTTDGIDVHASYDPHPAGCPPILLADDFQCLQTGFLTNIVVWGSWYGDFLPTNPQGQIDPAHVEFTLSIHEDIPAGATTHSRPGPVIWLATFPPGSFIHGVEAANIREGWMDPLGCPTNYVFPADTVCHRYEFNMPSAVVPEPFLQVGTAANPKVYWLDVQARIVNPEQVPRPMFGWKTSTDHWNDDATWASGTDGFPGPSPDAWGELIYPPTHPKEGASIDLAFRINTQATTSTGEETLKWSQPPYVADMLTNVYNGWNEPSLYNSPQIVADDWACTNSDKVSDVHWWGSYIGWCETNPPPVVPDGFLLSI